MNMANAKLYLEIDKNMDLLYLIDMKMQKELKINKTANLMEEIN